MNICASFPWRLLAAATLNGQLKRDRSSERHSVDVVSIEHIVAGNWVSDDSMRSSCMLSSKEQSAPDSQGMLAGFAHGDPVFSGIHYICEEYPGKSAAPWQVRTDNRATNVVIVPETESVVALLCSVDHH